MCSLEVLLRGQHFNNLINLSTSLPLSKYYLILIAFKVIVLALMSNIFYIES